MLVVSCPREPRGEASVATTRRATEHSSLPYWVEMTVVSVKSLLVMVIPMPQTLRLRRLSTLAGLDRFQESRGCLCFGVLGGFFCDHLSRPLRYAHPTDSDWQRLPCRYGRTCRDQSEGEACLGPVGRFARKLS